MNCRRTREQLRRAAEARAHLLLRLGSERDEGVMVRPGFEQRLRARLSAEADVARTSAWNGGFERLVRPALAAAAALVLVCAGLYVQVAAPQGGGDLASLLETDPVFTSILTTNPDAMFADPQSAPATDGP
jgi:anti-sigma-K factor RskA